MAQVKFNLNQTVKVKLNDTGFSVHRNDFITSFHGLDIPRGQYHKPEVDANGYSEFKMYELMNLFGGCLYNGSMCLPFESMEIILEVEC